LLKRNPYFWERDSSGKPLPAFDTIRLDIQSNPDIEVARFLRGETNMIRKLEPADFARVAKEKPAARATWGLRRTRNFFGSIRRRRYRAMEAELVYFGGLPPRRQCSD